MKRSAKKTTDEMRPEYDLAELLKGGVVGKHAKSFQAGTNLVLIEPQIHSQFKSDQEVNDALRLVIELRKIGGTRRAPRRSSSQSKTNENGQRCLERAVLRLRPDYRDSAERMAAVTTR